MCNFKADFVIIFSILLLFSFKGHAAEISVINTPHNKCNLLILGDIAINDEKKFRKAVASILKSGCDIPRINIYSPGGSYRTAIQIANDVQDLHAITIAPRLISRLIRSEKDAITPENGERSCEFMPGEEERLRHESQKLDDNVQATIKAWRQGKRAPRNTVQMGTYDPRTDRGDSRCTCASACFLIWIAGAERRGDVVLIHRPYFDPIFYRELDITNAREAFRALTSDAREFLSGLEVSTDIVDKVFSTPSDKAIYLSQVELENLRMAAYYAELKTAQCGPEPGPEPTLHSDATEKYDGPYTHLTPAKRRELIKLLKREQCWRDKQAQTRQKINAAFLSKYGLN